MSTPTIDQLKLGLQIAEKIAALETEMAALFAGRATTVSAAAPAAPKAKEPRKKHNLSPQAIANIRAAQKKRWAKVNAAKAALKPAAAPAAASKPATKKKGGFSQGHKAKLAAAAKKRWAAIRAGKLQNPFAAKK